MTLCASHVSSLSEIYNSIMRSVNKLGLLFFANPLNHSEIDIDGSTSSTNLTASQPPPPRSICPPESAKTWESSAAEVRHDGKSSRPFFKPRHQARTVELFFDLFFVANLTIFSIDHEINDGASKDLLPSLFKIPRTGCYHHRWRSFHWYPSSAEIGHKGRSLRSKADTLS